MANSTSAGTTTSTDDESRVPGPSFALMITAQPPSMLRGKTVEEIMNKWSSYLEVQVKEFSKFATEVAVWDLALIENGNTVSLRSASPRISFSHWLTVTAFDLAGDAMSEMLLAEREQADIDRALDHIEQQQKGLMTTLEIYEKTAEETRAGDSGDWTPDPPIPNETESQCIWGIVPDGDLTAHSS